MLQAKELKTLDGVRGSLAVNQTVEIKTRQCELAYAFIDQALRRFGYARSGRVEKGLLRAYAGKVTEMPRVQSVQLVAR